MTYTPDIPVTGDSLGSTRDRIRGNFQQIAVVQAVNHVGFNESGEGKHKFLQMPEQLTAPTTLLNEAGFYCKEGANPQEANLFFRGESNGFEYQLTNAIQASNATFGNNTVYDGGVPLQSGGWTFLPGGLLMQYGKNGNISLTNSLSTVFPVAFSEVYSLTFSTTQFDPTRISSLTPTGFTIQRNTSIPFPSPVTYYWTAIGRAV